MCESNMLKATTRMRWMKRDCMPHIPNRFIGQPISSLAPARPKLAESRLQVPGAAARGRQAAALQGPGHRRAREPAALPGRLGVGRAGRPAAPLPSRAAGPAAAAGRALPPPALHAGPGGRNLCAFGRATGQLAAVGWPRGPPAPGGIHRDRQGRALDSCGKQRAVEAGADRGRPDTRRSCALGHRGARVAAPRLGGGGPRSAGPGVAGRTAAAPPRRGKSGLWRRVHVRRSALINAYNLPAHPAQGARTSGALARLATGALGAGLWACAAWDLAALALGTDYARLCRAVFLLAQIRLVQTQGFNVSGTP